PMERVDAELHGWPLATWRSKQDTDTHYKRVIEYGLDPNRIRNVRIGVAGHNLFDIAFAWLLAGRRKVRDGVDFEMLLGMAPGQAEAVRREVGGLLLYTPVVHPDEFDVAIAYLVRRLQEGASSDNFLSALHQLNDDQGLFERERSRFRASLAGLDRSIPLPFRTQDRRRPIDPDAVMLEPANVPDTDPSLAGNRAWGRAILERVSHSRLGIELVEAHTLTTPDQLERTITTALAAGPAWSDQTASARAAVLRRAAVELERRRAQLIEVMAAECGKTIDQADPEVSEAIDFANYYAALAEELDRVDGAAPRPLRLTVVTPPWNFPIAIAAGSTLAPLAVGSAVVVKPAPQAQRCGSLMVEALWAAGVPRAALQLAHLAEADLGRSLVSDPRVDRVILTGGYETAQLFRSFRPELRLLAETSGKNAIVITPSADLDLAVKDIVTSAFGHAGQKCSAGSLAILVGSVAQSRRFRNQIVDAVTSLRVGLPADPTTQIGPIVEPACGKLLRALTTLGTGESWLVEPRELDPPPPHAPRRAAEGEGGGTQGRLWTPGVRIGVRPGSEYHRTEYFGPVLGIMAAATLEEAINVQNDVEYGLTAGLHSRDQDEIATWIGAVQAGNLYVNRGITGAIVQRQPFGGWKKSAVGPGAKAGGPNYLIALSDWVSRPATAVAPLDPTVLPLFEAAAASLDDDARAALERSLRSDAAAWAAEFGSARDVCGLTFERNLLRYVATPVRVRLAEGGGVAALVRVVAAGVLAQAPITVSTGVALSNDLLRAFRQVRVEAQAEDDAAWLQSLSAYTGRVRLIGGDFAALAKATGGRPDLAVYDHAVTESGRIEMLPFLREQVISMTAHRFGLPDGLADHTLAGGGHPRTRPMRNDRSR
ncbi:MAG TPA: proline dehydrogenase family protein, partial [Terriglobales bacterium]|nr:proline dehydrogenase family protein [Terriglobales bacterium]